MRGGIILITAFLLLVSLSGPASAHRVNLFAYQEDGVVHAEAYFVDGTPCRNAEITATDAGGAVVARGLTDSEGLFSFPCELTGDLTIAVRASMGHGNEILLAVGEQDVMEGATAEEGSAGSGQDSVQAAEGISPLDEAAIVKIIEARIRPVRDSVREIRKKLEKPTLGKIIGGLGWIIGLAGAYLWGVSRHRTKA